MEGRNGEKRHRRGAGAATYGSVMQPTIPAPEAALLERTAANIAETGPSLTGLQRCEVAALCRTFAFDPPADPPDDAPGELVWRLTVAPHTVRSEWLTELDAAGIDAAAYVEVLGIVARLTAVDTFCFALGAPPVEIPGGSSEPATGAVAPDASIDGGWVPTVGPAWPPSALSLVPSEHEAMHDVHAALYLSMEQMVDMHIDRGLHRTQMELVAARTSRLNECFY